MYVVELVAILEQIFWNQGRTQEIKERYIHLGGNE